MLFFFGIIILCVALGLIVYGLHRYQSIEVEYTVDRTMPLPPLEGKHLRSIQLRKTAELDYPTGTSSLSQSPTANPPEPRGDQSQSAKQAKSRSQTHAVRSAGSAGWQEQVSTAKQAGDFSSALKLCEQQFPLWGAYNQYCIVLRHQLKATPANHQEQEEILGRLYATAAIAELLHDKSEGATRFSLKQLRSMALDKLPSLPMPYFEIGYAQLRLIRKSDVKLMISLWGRPNGHLAPRQYHDQWWLEFSQKLAG